eukprot:CAMPEP_0119011340 /NCGR_PEP_ID=MMETSP1176-20130426/5608_1 /TAXON_ID=265551 /ORGANISM="Synedropsis recta cf, Strain CCMP1620" /LENGTH=424 /DNA_ID=CAMNT_0006964143 /DNA_START=54 /DNA_END=1328 /DNA_ORIENTATION=+
MLSFNSLTIFALLAGGATAFAPQHASSRVAAASSSSSSELQADRREFLNGLVAATVGTSSALLLPNAASASVYLDPAMYGDQELRVAAVDSLRERVRQSILKKPSLAPAFYQLAMLDGLSYSFDSKDYGPDGSVVRAVLSSKNTDKYTLDLQEACEVLINAGVALKKYTAVTIGDAVAIGGAESIHTVGGPTLPVQLGRMEPDKKNKISNLDINLFNGNAPPQKVNDAFKAAGLTEREMTALLGGLMTLETVEKTRSSEDWKEQSRPKFREPGKMGRMSEFRKLTDEDIAEMEADAELIDDGGEYIVDSFGTRDQAFGERIGKDQINEKNFNKFLQQLNTAGKKGESAAQFGWISTVLLDTNNPPTQAWLNKYASSNLTYLKDLGVAFNALTQLGGQYTGGKYEALLKNKPRKSLNNDDLGGIF